MSITKLSDIIFLSSWSNLAQTSPIKCVPPLQSKYTIIKIESDRIESSGINVVVRVLCPDRCMVFSQRSFGHLVMTESKGLISMMESQKELKPIILHIIGLMLHSYTETKVTLFY